MQRSGSNTWLVAVLAIAVGFLAALLIFGGNDDSGSGSRTTTTSAGSATTTAPSTPAPTASSCVDLWNQSANRPNQVFLVNVMSREPVRVHVGVTSDVPPKCLVTVTANSGAAYVFPQAGGGTVQYTQAPPSTPGSSLPAGQKTSNALEQRDGTLAER
jgi:hypothetical protein